MERRTAIYGLLIAGAASIVRRGAAREPQAEPQGFTIHSDVRLVVLDVSVKDRSGGLVPGLARNNFAVFENGTQQHIAVFGREDLPVTVGILVDDSRSMGPKRPDVITAARTLIAEGNPRDETFILNFNETVRRGLPENELFSSDIRSLSTALYRGRADGRTALYDAVYDGLKQLDLGHREKKALVLISDGGDNASRHDRHDIFDKLDGSIATIYAVGLYDDDDMDQSPGVLKHLAGVSGGEAYFPASPADMTDVCRAIAKDIRTRYTIGYVPPAINGGSLRHVHVKVTAPSHPRLTARARTQYRFEEPGNGKGR
ncbi:MAG TPA: VWA domain-containing protein [Bryobacteraceae bacterium]|jgi:VWFA-related protein|nr:VWA domain-containing protein [Bryobacteraceae bacterium]